MRLKLAKGFSAFDEAFLQEEGNLNFVYTNAGILSCTFCKGVGDDYVGFP